VLETLIGNSFCIMPACRTVADALACLKTEFMPSINTWFVLGKAF
jgi:hypothetical protein